MGSVTLLHYSTTLLVIISVIPHKCEDSDEMELACGTCNKCTKKAQDMQSKYFPELQMKTGKNYSITTPSILEKTFPSLMYDFLMVVFLWDVSSFSTQFSDWTEGNPGYFSNLLHPLIRKCSKVQTRSSTKGQKTRNKTEDRPAERRQHQNKRSTDDVPQQRKDPPDNVKQKVSDRSTWSSNYSLSKLRLKQIEDQDISCVYKYVEKGQRPYRSEVCSWSPASRHYMHLWDQLIILQGVVFRKFDKRDKTDQYLQLLTPHSKCVISWGFESISPPPPYWIKPADTAFRISSVWSVSGGRLILY